MLMAGEQGSCWVLTVGRKAPRLPHCFIKEAHFQNICTDKKKKKRSMNPGLKKEKKEKHQSE